MVWVCCSVLSVLCGLRQGQARVARVCLCRSRRSTALLRTTPAWSPVSFHGSAHFDFRRFSVCFADPRKRCTALSVDVLCFLREVVRFPSLRQRTLSWVGRVCRMGSWAVNKYRMLAVRKRLTDNSPPSSAMLRALAVLVRLSANPNPPRCRPSYPPHEGCCLLDGPTTPVKADTILTPAPGVRFKAG